MSVDPGRFVAACAAQRVDLFTGVPDSLLKHLNAALPADRQVTAANEGAAIGIAIGHYLRTGTPAAVYLQNSGFGNAVNPLLSLADPDVYGIPMLVIVGWRGQPGVPDEPQHVVQGRVMVPLLAALELPWAVLPADQDGAQRCLAEAVATATARPGPYVLMVAKDTFTPPPPTDPPSADPLPLPSREEALVALAQAIDRRPAGGTAGPIMVATTGMLSRELFEHRARTGSGGERDFLTVGGMGHASAIALGIARSEPDREVWCLDGDGAVLMHLGTLATIAEQAPARFRHVVFNNGVHDSVGGQPTSMSVVDLPAAARALGYRHAAATADLTTLPTEVATLRAAAGPALLELRVRPGSRPDLGRPTRSPAESRRGFMAAVR